MIVCKQLAVFAKAPVAGEVKTRLTPSISSAQTCKLHKKLVLHTLQMATSLAFCQSVLFASKADKWWDELLQEHPVELHYQQGKDLGERMHSAIQVLWSALEETKMASQILLIGTDCPFITDEYIKQAYSELNDSDLVIGPAEDGGYVLIGMTAPHRELFEGVDWGTAQVLDQTLAIAHSLGLSYRVLSVQRDIDRPEDFSFLKARMPELISGIL